VIIAFLWNLWKRRNAMIFQNENEPLHVLLSRIISDLALWSHRCSKEAPKALLMDWGIMLNHLAQTM
jgi:hypothetical protein